MKTHTNKLLPLPTFLPIFFVDEESLPSSIVNIKQFITKKETRKSNNKYCLHFINSKQYVCDNAIN